MSGAPPLISVVMPTYNGAAFVAETLASVFAQTMTDFEIVVVDDASQDTTLALLRSIDDPRLVVIASPTNGGPIAARNKAFAAARGRYIVGLDQDDLCHPTRFARQSAWLDAHPGTVLVASAVDQIEGGRRTPPRPPFTATREVIDWRLRIANPIVWSSVMFRADAVHRLGQFERPDYLYAEDFDLYHRLRPFGMIERIDEPLVTYRVHRHGASQRFTSRMEASATAVLAGIYEPIFGADASDVASLVTTHIAAGAPVPDTETLARLAQVLERLHEEFVMSRAPGADALRGVLAEFARVWWNVVACAVRSGAVSLTEASTIRPAALAEAEPPHPRITLSRLIGASQRLVGRLRDADGRGLRRHAA